MGRKVEETRGTGYVETPLVVSMAATSSSSSSFSCFTRGVKIKEGERERKKKKREKRGRVWEWVYGGEADVINGNCAKVPRRTRVTPVPH